MPLKQIIFSEYSLSFLGGGNNTTNWGLKGFEYKGFKTVLNLIFDH